MRKSFVAQLDLGAGAIDLVDRLAIQMPLSTTKSIRQRIAALNLSAATITITIAKGFCDSDLLR